DINRVKSRIIGKEGKTRNTLEKLSKTHISIKGKTVSIIGEIDRINLAKRGLLKLIQGTPHSAVYKELEEIRSQKPW
ncbi:MAG: KH domain-containing protein, partial [archaeon]